MVDVVIALLPILLIVVSGIIKGKYSKEGKEEKEQEKLGEAFANKDTTFIAVELDYYDRMLEEKDRNPTGRKADN
jgi:hypothetical protein